MAQLDLLIESKVEEITPQQAALWLEINTHNRPLQYERSVALAGAIKRGEWAINGDAIRFCNNGQLIDGQHRLQAIVIAGQAVKTLVVRGLAPGSFATIDTNRKSRNPRDVMALSGVANYNVIAPIARLIHNWELCGFPYDHRTEMAPSAEQLLVIAQRPELAPIANRVLSSRWCRKFIGSGLTGFAMYAFGQYRPEHATEFFRKLETGIGLEAGSPILLLRDRMLNVGGPHESIKPVAKGAYVFKAWRQYLAGTHVSSLRVQFHKGQPMKEHFLVDKMAKPINLNAPDDLLT